MKNLLFAIAFVAGTAFSFASNNSGISEKTSVLESSVTEQVMSAPEEARAEEDVIIIIFDDGTVIIIITE